VYTDGGAINNPGPAGIGVVIKYKTSHFAEASRDRFHFAKASRDRQISKSKTIHQISRYIGEATNNQAEYRAVIEALSWIKSEIEKRKTTADIHFFLDSELIANQLNLKYKVKNSELQPLFLKVHNLVVSLGNTSTVRFQYIPREQNKEADKLVKKAIKEGYGG